MDDIGFVHNEQEFSSVIFVVVELSWVNSQTIDLLDAHSTRQIDFVSVLGELLLLLFLCIRVSGVEGVHVHFCFSPENCFQMAITSLIEVTQFKAND